MKDVWIKKSGADCFVVYVGAVPHESVGVVVFAVNDSFGNVLDCVFNDVDVGKLL